MGIEYVRKAKRLVAIAETLAFTSFEQINAKCDSASEFIDDPPLFIRLMCIAGTLTGFVHADLEDELEVAAFADAIWETLQASVETVQAREIALEHFKLSDWVDRETLVHGLRPKSEYSWIMSSWVTCNVLGREPIEDENRITLALSELLESVFNDWWNNELSRWLGITSDVPDIFASQAILSSHLMVAAAWDIPDDLPAEQKEHIQRVHRRDLENLKRLIYESSTHSQAKRLLVECIKGNKDFALYLRNFDPEASEKIVPNNDGLVPSMDEGLPVVLSTLSFNRQFEQQIETRISRHIPIVTLANPADFLSRGSIPALQVRGPYWFEFIEMIAERARIVIILFSGFSSGLSSELTLLSRLNRKDATVIILKETTNDEVIKLARTFTKEKEPEIDWEASALRLSEFGLVIREHEIDEGLRKIENMLID